MRPNTLKHYYTLHVVYTPTRDDERRIRDDVLKISWLERANRTRLGIGEALRSVFVPGPWPYAIDIPLLTESKHGGTHEGYSVGVCVHFRESIL